MPQEPIDKIVIAEKSEQLELFYCEQFTVPLTTGNWQLATAMTLAPPDALDRAMLFGTNEMVEMNSALTIPVLPRRPEPAITRRSARSQTALQERPR